MKPKMHHHVQPREGEPVRNEQASEEIKKFLRALDSYPDRVAKEPSVSFRRHLSSLFKASRKKPDEPRRH
ncbi:MAG: hypothetical protein WAL52_20000 [Candidatus Sulfotelmatobacter sp.]